MSKLAVVIHVYKEKLSAGEVISLKQLRKMLGAWPAVLIAPQGLDSTAYRTILGDMLVNTIYFDRKHFKDLKAYNALLLSKAYYKPFLQYEHILLHHTDSFVFKNELKEWIDRGYDNIGAPVYGYDGTLHPSEFICCGNGGLCLRNVKKFYSIAESLASVYRYEEIKNDFIKYNWKGRISRSLLYLKLISTVGSRLHPAFNSLTENEDVIWGYLVPKYVGGFKVAPLDTGMQFSMEFNCDKLLERNNHQLPFGCHGWYKPLFFDFWKPYVEAAGHDVSAISSIGS